MDESNFYSQVPKGLAENLQYRLDIRKRAQHDKGFRRAVMTACKHDVLFLFNAFFFLHEPRPRTLNGKLLPTCIPFITWEHQDPAILKIRKHLGFRDVAVEKARGEGASWIAMMLALQDWLFKDSTVIGVVSKNELTVDNPSDPGSLFWKFAHGIAHLPTWMVPPFKRSIDKHTFLNESNGSVITGYAATADLASGARTAQPLNCKVMTPAGYRLMGELREGDRVTGRDGLPCRVTGVYPQGIRKVYCVQFSDGSKTKCCGDHLWPITVLWERYMATKNKNHIIPLRDMLSDYIIRHGGVDKKKYYIPITRPVEFDPIDLPLDPYLVGCLVGDGYVAPKNVPCFATDDMELLDYLGPMLPAGCKFKKHRHQVFDIVRTSHKGTNPLKDAFRELDILRTGVDKKIPKIYLRGTVEQRLAMVRGLMDTDGHVQLNKGKATSSFTCFTTISPQLAKDFMELIYSLGGTCRSSSTIPKFRYKGEMRTGKRAYSLYPNMPDGMCPFRLGRKAEKYIDSPKYKACRAIAKVEECGEEECRCIRVDAPDHLYLTDDCIVTHNSWFVFDELSKFSRGPEQADKKAITSVQQVTDSRLVISTPLGTDGAYYDIMHTPSNMVKVILDWKDNQTKNRGLYEMKKGKPIAVDPVNSPLPKNYTEESKKLFARLRSKGFKLDKCLRSPWYDNECDRMDATPQSIAQELDRDYGGSVFKTFVTDFFDRARPTVRAPFIRGNLTYHPETLVPDFGEVENGPLLLWTTVDARCQVPAHMFALGIDVSTGGGGTYTSNSAVEVIDLTTMEQVAEFADNVIEPSDFADFCIALAKWFNNAYMAFETNGPGVPFAKQILKRQYENVYRRTVHLQRSKKKGRVVGWRTDKDSKKIMFDDLSRSVRTSELTLRSNDLVQECAQYEWVNGQIQHVLVKSADGASAGEAHGDRVIAMGVCLQAVQDRPLLKTNAEEEIRPNPPRDSMAYRLLEYEKERKKKLDRWDNRTLWDMAHPA